LPLKPVTVIPYRRLRPDARLDFGDIACN